MFFTQFKECLPLQVHPISSGKSEGFKRETFQSVSLTPCMEQVIQSMASITFCHCGVHGGRTEVQHNMSLSAQWPKTGAISE